MQGNNYSGPQVCQSARPLLAADVARTSFLDTRLKLYLPAYGCVSITLKSSADDELRVSNNLTG